MRATGINLIDIVMSREERVVVGVVDGVFQSFGETDDKMNSRKYLCFEKYKNGKVFIDLPGKKVGRKGECL